MFFPGGWDFHFIVIPEGQEDFDVIILNFIYSDPLFGMTLMYGGWVFPFYRVRRFQENHSFWGLVASIL